MEQDFKFGDKIIANECGGYILGEFICYDPRDGDVIYISEELNGDGFEIDEYCFAYFLIPPEIRDSLLGKEASYCSPHKCKLYEERKPKVTPGMKCCNRYCGEFFEHVVPNVGNHFMCYRCRSEPLTYQTVLASLQIG